MTKKLKDLNPTKGNPRLDWTAEQQEAFKKSIREFGDLSGIIYNRKSKQLVGGNKRRDEFLQGDGTVMIVTELEKPDSVGTVAWGYVDVNGTRFNYREVDWPRKKELAANLAANQHGADWDWSGVSGFMKEIDDVDYLEFTGFAKHDISNLIAAEWSPETDSEMPKPSASEKVDMIVLDREARKLLDQVKKRIKQKDDLIALKEICSNR